MNSSAKLCTFICVLTQHLGSPINLMAADESTRTFTAQKCRFTLPGADWTWIDTPGPDLVFMARNTTGFVINLAAKSAPQPAQVDQQFVNGFEKKFYQTGGLKKRGGQFLTYRGLPTYQATGTVADGITSSTRVFFAHGLGYVLTVLGEKEPVEDDPIFEKLMEGFEFTAQPQPPAESDYGRALNVSEWMGRIAGACIVVAIPLLVFQWVSRRRKTGKP
jgi:hypothetical protein